MHNWTAKDSFELGIKEMQVGLRLLKPEKARLKEYQKVVRKRYEDAELRAKSGREVDKLNMIDKKRKLQMVNAIVMAVDSLK